jgi:hypothetical protein
MMNFAVGRMGTQDYVIIDNEFIAVTRGTQRAFAEYIEQNLSDSEFEERRDRYNAEYAYNNELVECPICRKAKVTRGCAEIFIKNGSDTSFHDYMVHVEPYYLPKTL